MPLRYGIALGICGLIVAGLWLLAPRFWHGDYRHYVDQMY